MKNAPQRMSECYDEEMTKGKLRADILAVRDAIDSGNRAEYDRAITGKVMSVLTDMDVQTVLTYVSFRSEVDTHGIINECLSRGIRVAVPRVEKHEINFYHISSMNDLINGYMGISEPTEYCKKWDDYEQTNPTGHNHTDDSQEISRDCNETGSRRDVIIVPGSVFDRKGFRIGYGGGYYDRFLASHPNLYSIGLAYECQLVDAIPVDEWDVRVDMVITLNGEIV